MTVDLPPLSGDEAVKLHEKIMRMFPSEPVGVRDRSVLESALARPQHARAYASADLAGQAATLVWGLVKAHAFLNGNKRTAWEITQFLLEGAGFHVGAQRQAILDMLYGIDNESRAVEDVAAWFRVHLARQA